MYNQEQLLEKMIGMTMYAKRASVVEPEHQRKALIEKVEIDSDGVVRIFTTKPREKNGTSKEWKDLRESDNSQPWLEVAKEKILGLKENPNGALSFFAKGYYFRTEPQMTVIEEGGETIWESEDLQDYVPGILLQETGRVVVVSTVTRIQEIDGLVTIFGVREKLVSKVFGGEKNIKEDLSLEELLTQLQIGTTGLRYRATTERLEWEVEGNYTMKMLKAPENQRAISDFEGPWSESFHVCSAVEKKKRSKGHETDKGE